MEALTCLPKAQQCLGPLAVRVTQAGDETCAHSDCRRCWKELLLQTELLWGPGMSFPLRFWGAASCVFSREALSQSEPAGPEPGLRPLVQNRCPENGHSLWHPRGEGFLLSSAVACNHGLHHSATPLSQSSAPTDHTDHHLQPGVLLSRWLQ